MKKVLILLIAGIFLLVGCGKKEEVKAPPKEEVKIQMYVTPTPDFSLILNDLAELGNVNFKRILKNMETAHPKSLDKVAFNLGAGVADALVGLKAKDKSSLMDKTKELINYAEVLGVSEKYLKLSDSLRIYVEDEEWKEVENQLEKYKKAILDELFDLESFDQVVMIQYGGWIRGLQNVSDIMYKDIKDKNATKMLANKTIVKALLHDLPLITDQKVLTSDYYKLSLENVNKISEIIIGSEDGTFNQDQVKQLHDLAQTITKSFSE